ncbi:MAG: hypothetical protein FP825_05000 [Hyphomonas sp.]|uniref:hypothetical protein n=1 Tax=Hyphomonas sp. TaxID=87 RepID=UPI00183D52C8|nr:hypothetical protein [Hyphomonas sp.]MBA3067824.1 hypothetical protein [Hyphomonas sp.]MBU3919959.1 hypothetical protein [Alphaproteobacteria bacterium]MBU4062380.1 hypothetical protein [Alphaproteobacteria bacterium]MBU4166012.1 hypothetical protein [Alphaproteobacteria bacterium]
MFTDRFSSFICPGDVITCEAGPFTVLAQVVPDDCPDAPDQRQDGFWPSLYIGAPGFIGPGKGFRQRFAEAQAMAEAAMEGWRKGGWFYCGIVLSVSLDGVDLANHAASLWGIEANYPNTDNSYLAEVANDLLPEAIAVARETLARLAAHDVSMEGA